MFILACICGKKYESRYRRRKTACPSCLAKRKRFRQNNPLNLDARVWIHQRYIAVELLGPDARIKSQLNGFT